MESKGESTAGLNLAPTAGVQATVQVASGVPVAGARLKTCIILPEKLEQLEGILTLGELGHFKVTPQ